MFSTPVSYAVPAFPGATNTVFIRSDWASFQASACSLPPPPTTNTFISSMPKVTVQKILAEGCPECERPLAEKIGRNGKFIACTGFPDCRYSKPYHVSTGVACPRCGGDLVQRRGGKMGRVFYGCSSYPACDFSLRQKPIAGACPECSGLLVKARGDSIS